MPTLHGKINSFYSYSREKILLLKMSHSHKSKFTGMGHRQMVQMTL